jgi:tartrate-resistant acid phosphatase type 5
MIPSLPSISRREALRQTFFFSAALAFGQHARRLQAAEVAGGDLHFLMIGDWGPNPTDGKIPKSQLAVAAGMKSYAEALKLKPDALFLLGDNFYGGFKEGMESPRWKIGFEDLYPAERFPGPCWALLGNHDYDEEIGIKMEAQLAYGKKNPGTRWTMPAKWYRVEWPKVNPLITCLVLDSNFNNKNQSLTPAERAAQLAWLKAELAKPRTTPWMVCLGHHPLYSNGPHGDGPLLIEEWGPLFSQHRVDAYFCGHDHDLQHLEFEGLRTSFIVSGGGGARITELKQPDRGPYSKSIYGFSHLQVSKDKLIVRHIDPNLNLLHAFSRTLDGKVRIAP